MAGNDVTLLTAWVDHRDTEAMTTIVRRHSSMVYTTCLRVLGNDADARDVAQECFIKLAGVETVGASLSGLLHTMATRQSLNRIRSEGRRRARERSYAELHENSTEASWDDVQQFVDEAIAELPEKTREAIVRHYFQGETHEAIAREEGVTRAAISHRIERGIATVRSLLEARGVPIVGTALAALLAAQGAQAAPAAFTAGLTKLAIAGAKSTSAAGAGVSAAAGTATGASVLGGMTMTKIAAVAAIVIGAPTVGFMTMTGGAVDPVSGQTVTESPATEGGVEESGPEAVAARLEAFLATLDDVDVAGDNVAYGTMVSATGYARGSVETFPVADINAYRRTEDSTLDGHFIIKDLKPEERQWFAGSRPTRRAALFTIPDSIEARKGMRIELKMYETQIVGYLLRSDGAGVAKANLAARVQRKNGDSYILTTKRWMYSQAGGYYKIHVPTEEGARVAIGIVPPGADEAEFWSDPFLTEAETYSLEFPDIVVPDGLAEMIKTKGEVSRTFASNVVESPRARYGGIVVDEEGRPIEGVALALSFSSKPGFGASGLAVSNRDGRWSTLLPEHLDNVSLRARHPDYVDTWLTDTRSITLPLARLKDLTSEVVLQRGSKVFGYVRDSKGRPVPDALIDPGTITSFQTTSLGSIPTENETTTRTDADGYFELNCLPEGDGHLLILARGYAPEVASLDVTGDMEPTTIELNEGAVIRGRFTDEDGNPLEGAYLYSRDWNLDQRYQVNIRADTDADGKFELRNVPREGSIRYSFGQRGKNRRKYISMSGELTPREEPYEITMYRPPVIEGTVVDDETGKPVTEFTVNGGWKWAGSDTFSFDRMGRATDVQDDEGHFKKTITGVSVSYPPDIPFAVHVSAEGYYAAFTPEVRLGEKLEPITVRLHRGEWWEGKVVDAAGRPVSGVKVAQIQPGEMANVRNGLLQFQFGNTPSNTFDTKEDGAFSLPPVESRCGVLALHESGYAYIEGEGELRDAEMVLTPWAKVQGVIYTGEEVEGNSMVMMQAVESRGEEDTPLVTWNFWDASHKDGRFEFDFVPSIQLNVGRAVAAASQVILSHNVYLTPEAGEHHTVNVGKGGLTLRGRIDWPSDPSMAFDVKQIHAVASRTGGDGDSDFLETNYVPRFDEDGSFRIEGLLPGNYELSVALHAPPPPNVCGAGLILATGDGRFSIPAGDAEKEITMAAFPLQVLERPDTGSVVPELMGFTLDGDEFYLEKLRGSYVVLDFWASWCLPCRREIPKVKSLWERFGNRGGVAFVGLNFDFGEDTARRFIKSEGMNWTQFNSGPWGPENPVLKEFLVSAIPSMWLIDPEGKIVARDLTADQLEPLLDARTR